MIASIITWLLTSKLGRGIGAIGLAIGAIGAIYLKGRNDQRQAQITKQSRLDLEQTKRRLKIEREVNDLDDSAVRDRMRGYIID